MITNLFTTPLYRADRNALGGEIDNEDLLDNCYAIAEDDEAGQAMVWQWSVWGISEIEPYQMQIVVEKFFTPEDRKNDRVIPRAEKGLARPLGVLESGRFVQP